MLKLNIKIEDAGALASVRAITAGLEDRAGLHSSMAMAVETDVKSHLQANYVPRNKRGDFWKRVHDSVEVHSDEQGGSVALVETGIALRYHGGEVYPGKNKVASGPRIGQLTRALAVPSDHVPVVGGRQQTPAHMGILAFLRAATAGDTVGYLVEGEERQITRGKNKGKMRIVPKTGGSLLYTLRSVTRHAADKNILPNDEALLNAATSAARDWFDSFEE